MERASHIEESISDLLNNKRTFGKTVDEWHRDLSLAIDPSADPAKVNLYCSQLGERLNLAYKNLDKTKMLYFLFRLSYDRARDNKITQQALSKGRKVMPALESMEKVAESQLGDRTLTSKQYEAMISFWQSMVFRLKDNIELIKIMGASNGTRAKIGGEY